MKKFLFLLSAIMLCGCDSDNGINYEDEKNSSVTVTGISMSTSEMVVGPENGSCSVSVRLTTEGYSYNEPEWRLIGGASWCTPSKTSGRGNDNIEFTVSENPDSDDRSATFTVTCQNLQSSFTITQKGNENFDCRFDYSYESYEYIGSDYVKSNEYRSFSFTKDSNNGNITSAEAQTLYGEYKFSSIGDWQITGGELWCKISPTSGSSTEGDMQISFTQNSNAESRSARFQITHNSDTHQFTITQNGFPNDIHVDTPGNLPLLVEKSVQTMNVSGELNSIDYDFIEAMPNLRSLRMTDVIGTKSFYLNASHSNITCLILPNELKEISLVRAPLVQELHIPAGVETILSGFDIKFLKHVIFEKNSQLKKISDSAFISLYELYEIDMSACTQLESIAELTFWKDKNLRKVKIGAKVPPQIGFSTFEGINPYAELYVPAESINAYKEAGWWKYFYSISPLD